MRRGFLLAVGAALLAAVGAMPWTGRVRAAEGPVTFSRQIAPILYTQCAGCHHAGGSGPFALTSYAEAKRWGSVMAPVVRSRTMPPWLPEPGHGDFANARRLGEEQIALIERWVAAGMPEGDAAEAPKAPVYSGEWQLGPPDLVLEVESPTTVPASGTDVFTNLILPAGLTETRWIRAMEIKPGSPQVVHHANLLVDRTASLRRLHPADWRRGVEGMGVAVDSGEVFDPDSHFLNWKPDSTALVEPPTMPWRLDLGNDLVLNLHLKPTGKVETLRARIGLYFAAGPATEMPILVQLEHDAALDIPPGDARFTVEDELTLPVDADLLAIYPHAHYLGKRLEGWAVLPGGERRDLLLIGSWDIDRQAIYRYAKPVALPKGTVLHMRYTYDNSAANPHNPNSPPVRVKAGNRSVDEMGHLWLQLLPHSAGGASGTEARAPILRAWMERRLSKDAADPTALFNLASLEMEAGDASVAAGLYGRALAGAAGDVRIVTALGTALSAAGDWQGARERFRAAVALDPSYAAARLDLGVTDLQHNELAEAETQFRTLLQLEPRDSAAHAGLGSALLRGGRVAEAQGEFESALGIDPGNFDALYNLSTIEAANDRTAQALGHLRAAAALRPDDVDVHRGLSALLAQSGDSAGAVREQEAVVKLAPADADGWNDLGVLRARSGDRTGARDAFAQALKLEPGNATVSANLARLQ